jgi:hypothetical protein
MGVTVMIVSGIAACVIMCVRLSCIVDVHSLHYCTVLLPELSGRCECPSKNRVIGKYDNSDREFVDAADIHCQHRK